MRAVSILLLLCCVSGCAEKAEPTSDTALVSPQATEEPVIILEVEEAVEEEEDDDVNESDEFEYFGEEGEQIMMFQMDDIADDISDDKAENTEEPPQESAVQQSDPDETLLKAKEAAIAAAAAELEKNKEPNAISAEEIDRILATLPEDISLARAAVVVKAYSMLGKVKYEWGGKSSEQGWDWDWNRTPKDGELYVRGVPHGLDCSGFVRWCFENAGGISMSGERFGSGTYKQWLSSHDVAIEDALPGDLMFRNEVARTNHNGIIVGKNAHGELLVIHACKEYEGIVLETATKADVHIVRRPNLYAGDIDSYFSRVVLHHSRAENMADVRYLLAVREWQIYE